MATANDTRFLDLKRRVAALGYRLFVTADGTQLIVDPNAEHSKVEVLFIHETDEDDNIEDWLASVWSDRHRKSEEQSGEAHEVRSHDDTAPPSVEAPDDEPARPRTTAERRAAILKAGNLDRAIGETEGALWTLHSFGELLCQDTVQDNSNWVLSIGDAIVELTEGVIELLDRPGGWRKSGGES
jgi:hypothetical protein